MLENEYIMGATVMMSFLFMYTFIKVNYKKDLYRKEIYLTISRYFIPLLIIGISKVEETDVDEFVNTLDILLRNSDKMEKREF